MLLLPLLLLRRLLPALLLGCHRTLLLLLALLLAGPFRLILCTKSNFLLLRFFFAIGRQSVNNGLLIHMAPTIIADTRHLADSDVVSRATDLLHLQRHREVGVC